MKLCPEHQAERNAWLDHQGPLHGGIRIESSGSPLHTIPSWQRTRETLVSQLKLIDEACSKH